MSISFQFYGTKQADSTADIQHLQSLHPNLKVVEYTGMAARSGLSKPVEVKAEEKDIIQLQLSNEVIWYYRADDFKTILERQSTARGADTNELRVPESFITEDENRGFPKFLVTQSVKVITGWAAKQTAIALANKLEDKLILGLHSCNEKMEFLNFDRNKALANKSYLLFIHGTNSSTFGSFQHLSFNDAYKKLYEKYEGRIIAFEHKSITESPLKNITQLLSQLPDNISLDIVSHSRGGIIADLLARCNNGELPFNNEEVRTVTNNPDLIILKQEVDAANKAATGKKLVINKLIRVACPAAGTVLIGKNLDNYVNVLCNLVKLIPGAGQAIPLTIFLDFAKAVVQERTDLKALPGLEAQMPESPFMKLLNNGIRKITSDLYVISGDVESSGFWNTLKVFGTNLYFGEAHDLVVNSNSMFKGTYRSSIVKEHFEQQSNINHFNYFKNVSSQNALLAVLINPLTVGEFFSELGPTADIHIVHERGAIGKKPMVYLLPGIMGSNLTVDDKSVWANYTRLCSGGLERLKAGSQKISAPSLHAATYNGLINYLSSDFDVMPFPYDWRMSVTQAAALLADNIEKAWKDPDRTCYECHFIAHSMGGLVLRAMIHLHKNVWDKIAGNKKTRVIMMGVPNEGSYGTIRILLGKDSIIKKLALLDFIHSKEFLLKMFQDYPGLIQLLPANYKDIFSTTTWNDMRTLNDEFTGIPSQKTLAEGAELYKIIKDTDFDNEIFRYVAGQDENTPENIDIQNGKITFTATPQGDGRVPWSTIPTALLPANIYYVPADHDSIPMYEEAFEGYKELLTKESTSLLSNIKPSTRSSNVSRIMPDSDFVTVPTENELKDRSITSTKEIPRNKKSRLQTVQVSVTNSDLTHSKYPVVVGHFMGDGIVKAEKFLNLALNSKLSEYHTAGNYPGAIGSHLVILKENIGFDENLACQGAVVVGLGEFGTLTENRLLLSLTQALLTLAIKHNEYLRHKKVPAGTIPEFGISSLLIGSDFAGLRIDTSIKTILTAVIQANDKLGAMDSNSYKKINRIEIIEIYQHKAIQIGRIINKFMKEDRFAHFKFLPSYLNPIRGFLRLIPDESQQGNWNRLEITVVKKGDTANTTSKRTLPILFTSITDKAHADEQLLPTNRLIVESLISQMAKYAKWDKSFSQTLYELLIPNNFKGYGSSLGNLVIIVDEETARYPWELLHDPNGISDKPMVVSTGMVRQLKTPDQRTAIKINTSNRALVIGNPNTNDRYPELPAAEKEAQSVATILQSKGLETTVSIKENDTEIVKKLLTLSYKIIHIASHGIVGSTIDEPTGVVIGSDIVFTAADFNQISIVPEFVFINVCSSDDFNILIAQKMRKKYDLAASVGTQLIQMGVKAAIVTGWEINDAAAAEFSREFYTQMMEGKGFGDSVHLARESTYNKFGAFNTWGAYQCYGDPFYTFPSSVSNSRNTTSAYVDTVEVMYELENLDNKVNSPLERTANKDYKAAIENIANNLQADWDKNPGIVEKFATVYTTLKQFDTAIQYYQKLFTLEDTEYSVKSVERYCNIRVRHASIQYENKLITRPAAIKTIKEAIDDLKKIHGTSCERYSLVAGAYARLFKVDNDMERSLKETARYYQLAYQYYKQTANELPYYPYFNWLHFALLLSSSKNKEPYLKLPPNRKELDNEALANAEQQDVQKQGFFHKAARCSFHLAALLSDKTGDVNKYINLIEADYKWARSFDGKPSEKDSFINYLKFIITLLVKLPATDTKEIRNKKAASLKVLVDKID